MLIVENIHSYYDKSHVLEGVSLTVNPGELVTLLGRNGAGKTTTLRSILGIICPRQGQIHFNGQALVGQKIFEIARQGLALVPENRGIFRLLTVEETCASPHARPAAGSSKTSTACSRASRSGAKTPATHCLAASNRCSPSPAPCSTTPSC